MAATGISGRRNIAKPRGFPLGSASGVRGSIAAMEAVQ
jgi:hypothetical protein